LCELFHCRPSELESEDGLFLLKLLDLKHWRDAAAHYDDDPQTGMVSNEDKKRFMYLSFGVKDALYLPLDELTESRIEEARANAWAMSKEKKAEVNMMMAELNALLRQEGDNA
jgi:hypothetical protein